MFQTRSIWPLILLPIFFVGHGYNEFYPIVPPVDSFELIAAYLLTGFLFSSTSWLLFKNWNKAHQMAFFMLAINFFFGAVQDTLRLQFPTLFVNKYSFLLTIILALVCFIYIHLKRKKSDAERPTTLLIIILIVLIGLDLCNILIKLNTPSGAKQAISKVQFQKISYDSIPDIHLIIADEYPGGQTLRNVLNYPNDSFENSLKRRGFYIADQSSSNYNFTEFSTASLFNMNYLKKIEGREVSLHHLGYCFEILNKSPFINYLIQHGYEFRNHSIFDFYGNPSPVIPTLLPGKTKPITEQTLMARIRRDLGFHFFTDLPWMADWFDLEGANLRNNKKLIQLTLASLRDSTERPTFTYTHLLMPHGPYYYSRKGQLLPRSQWNSKDTGTYFGYLEYSNQQLLNLIDSIRIHTRRPLAILLIGDHGLRTYPKEVEQKNHFLTLTSVLLPRRNYEKYYPKISHVNLIRTTLNSLFEDTLSQLKDSTSFLRE